VPSTSTGTPNWTNAPGFDKDVFTFVRIKRERKYGSGGSWTTDTPDSDLNLSFRLQQVTSIKVDPNGRYLWLTDKELVNYPFYLHGRAGDAFVERRRSEGAPKVFAQWRLSLGR